MDINWKSLSGLPKTKSGWFILICFATYVLCGTIKDIFLGFGTNDINYPARSEEPALRLLGTLSFISLMCALGATIIFGIRNIRVEGFSKKKMIVPILGIAACLTLASMCWFMNTHVYSIFDKVFIKMDENDDQKKLKLARHLTPEKYSEISKMIALNHFLKQGTIMEYTAPDGRVVPYEPDEGDRKLYAEITKAKHLWVEIEEKANIIMYSWLTVATAGVILGLVTPVRKKN